MAYTLVFIDNITDRLEYFNILKENLNESAEKFGTVFNNIILNTIHVYLRNGKLKYTSQLHHPPQSTDRAFMVKKVRQHDIRGKDVKEWEKMTLR